MLCRERIVKKVADAMAIVGGKMGVKLGCLTFIERLGSADRFVEGIRG
jgi:hypothetical protein